MKKTVSSISILLAILFFSGTVFAWPGGHGKKDCGDSCDRKGGKISQEQRQDHMENRLEKMAIILDFSDQQKDQLESLFEQKNQQRQEMRAKMQESRNDLREYKQKGEFNESEFRKLAEKSSNLKTEMMVQRASLHQQVLDVLTPEQQAKAEKLKGAHGEGFFGKRGGPKDCDSCNKDGKRGGKKPCNKG